MKLLIFVFSVLIFGVFYPVLGQDFRQEFKQFFDKSDFSAQEKVLKRWEAARPEDPELYVSYFNHYFAKSRQETVSLTTAPPQGVAVPLRKESDGKVAGYIGSNISFTKADFDAGISYIDKGITNFPNRLDMRFGKTYALGQIQDFSRFTDEIVKTIDRSNTNKNSWTWREGKPLEKPREFMLAAIQDYVVQIFDSGDEQVKFVKQIADTVLKYYPDHVESLSNLSVFYMMKGDFDAALVPLLRAEKLAPGDFVVIGNIAYSYYNRHDKPGATKYYQKLSELGDEGAKKDAAAKLSEIRNWK